MARDFLYKRPWLAIAQTHEEYKNYLKSYKFHLLTLLPPSLQFSALGVRWREGRARYRRLDIKELLYILDTSIY